MDYICPTCGEAMSRDLLRIIGHTEKHIIDAIREKNPDWVENNGVCRKCYEHYEHEMGHDTQKEGDD